MSKANNGHGSRSAQFEKQSNRNPLPISLLTTGTLLVILAASFFTLVLKMSQPGCNQRSYNSSTLGRFYFKILS